MENQTHSELDPQTIQALQEHFVPGSKEWNIKVHAQTLADWGQSTYDYLMQRGKVIAETRKAKASQLRDRLLDRSGIPPNL